MKKFYYEWRNVRTGEWKRSSQEFKTRKSIEKHFNDCFKAGLYIEEDRKNLRIITIETL